MPDAETPKPEPKPSKTPYVIPPLRQKRSETPVPRAKKVTAKAKPEPPPPPPEPKAKPAPKAKAPEPSGSDAERFGTLHKTKVTGKSEAWWKKQGMGVLKEQAQLRGRRFEERETKGDKSQGLPRFKRADYLRVMLELLKKEK